LVFKGAEMKKNLLFLGFMLFCSCGFALSLKVSGFNPGEFIPVQYTCSGEDISPEISWQDIPQGSKSLVLICEDPDAPMGVWTHWIIYNIPPEIMSLKQKFPKLIKTDKGILQGVNDFGKVGYNGPCPPPGMPHHYHFKLYALDIILSLPPGARRKDLLEAIQGHILAQADYIGLYQR